MIEEQVESIRESVRIFIIENFLFGNGEYELSNSDSLVKSGIIDSTGVMELIEFIGDRYAIEVLDDETIPGNLDSVLNISGYICRKLQVKSESR